jgi:hypothetical protein
VWGRSGGTGSVRWAGRVHVRSVGWMREVGCGSGARSGCARGQLDLGSRCWIP